MMYRLILTILAGFLWAGAAAAQQVGCLNATPCVQTNVFTPAASAILAVTTSSASVAYPAAAPVALITNTGANVAYVVQGGVSVVATTAGTAVQPGGSIALAMGTNTYLAAITGTSTASLTIQAGTGVPIITYGNTTSTQSGAWAVTLLAGTANVGGTMMAPTASSSFGIAPVVSASAEGSHVIKGSPGNFYGAYVTAGSTAGYLLMFDATSAPGDGAVTPKDCIYVPANTTTSLGYGGRPPSVYATGITAVFSTTGCFTKTASATAFIHGDAQ